MGVPDHVLGKSGEVIGTAASNGAAMQQSPESHWYDVWKNTGTGLMDHAKDGDVEYAVAVLRRLRV